MAELGSISGTVAGGAETKVSVEMLDYDYVSKSSDVNELRAILTTLESGKEGKYSHLEEHVRQRIFKVAPGTRRIGVEPTMQETAEALRDLEQWTKIEPSSFPKREANVAVPVRGRNAQIFASSSGLENTQKKKASKKRISGYDWDAWEKYNGDSDDDDSETKEKEQDQKTLSERRSRARDERMARLRSELVAEDMSKEARSFLAERERTKGNESFRAKDLEEAKFFYSKSLAYKDDDSRVYANRALVSLTMGNLEDAETDCDAALRIDPSYQKARARRGITRYKRGNYQRALEDFELLNNTDAKIDKLKDLARQQVQGDGGGDNRDDDVENMRKKKLSSGHFVKVTIRDEDDDDKEDNDAPQQEGARRIAIQIDEDSSDDDDDDVDASEPSQTPEHQQQQQAVRFEDDHDTNPSNLGRPHVRGQLDDDDTNDDALRRVADDEDVDGSTFCRIPITDEEEEEEEDEGKKCDLRRIPVAIEEDDDVTVDRTPTADNVDDEEPPPLRCPVSSIAEEKAKDAEEIQENDETENVAGLRDNEKLGVVDKEMEAKATKERGTQAMKRGDLEEAVRLYSESLEIFDTVAARNNRCLALLKLERWNEAIQDASGVLAVEQRNVKALFRRGLAHRGNGDRPAALKDLSSLLDIEPDNKLARKELDRTRRKTTERQALEFVDEPPPPPPSQRNKKDEVTVVKPPPSTDEQLTARLKAIDAALKCAPPRAPLPPPAKTTYELEREWRNLSGDESRQAEYLSSFTPAQMKKVTKPSLDVFGDVLLRISSLQVKNKAAELLIAASKAKSFGMMQALLSKPHANAVLKLESDLMSENDAALATKLRQGYEMLLTSYA